jgi:hypothetical protein
MDKIVIDLGVKRKGQLNESWIAMLGGWVEYFLKGLNLSSVSVRGTQPEVDSFVNALKSEKRHLDLAVSLGLNDPRVLNDKMRLMSAIQNFERQTGIAWPVK